MIFNDFEYFWNRSEIQKILKISIRIQDIDICRYLDALGEPVSGGCRYYTAMRNSRHTNIKAIKTISIQIYNIVYKIENDK